MKDRAKINNKAKFRGEMAKKYEKYSIVKFAKFVQIGGKLVGYSARNINMYKCCRLRKAIFSEGF